jgi:acyl-CoA thioesterase-1
VGLPALDGFLIRVILRAGSRIVRGHATTLAALLGAGLLIGVPLTERLPIPALGAQSQPPGKSATPGEARVIVALGDSLTAGFGVAKDDAWPALIGERLRAEGYPYRVVNAGVSGDTTAGGLRRVDWVLKARPDVVVVALGANDGLRAQSVAAIEANLVAIVERLKAGGARVLLAGMRMPPNYGAEYGRAYANVFPSVARRTGTTLMPFLLDGVAADRRLNQADGIHPTAEGYRVIADRLWPYLVPLLRK